jgi:glutathione synthase/RimK-type ligase-like ATP-grasp enzyme
MVSVLRIASASIFHATHYLAYLERLGVPVINGTCAHAIESSKARQLSLLSSLGVAYAQTKIVNHLSQVVAAARTLRFPVLVKANVGAHATRVIRFTSWEALQKAVDLYQINLGSDHTALVQEYIPGDNYIIRMHILDGKFLYAAKVYTCYEDVDYSPSEVSCKPNQFTRSDSMEISHAVENDYTPPLQLIQQAEQIYTGSLH